MISERTRREMAAPIWEMAVSIWDILPLRPYREDTDGDGRPVAVVGVVALPSPGPFTV
jgi:hypothetical protein